MWRVRSRRAARSVVLTWIMGGAAEGNDGVVTGAARLAPVAAAASTRRPRRGVLVITADDHQSPLHRRRAASAGPVHDDPDSSQGVFTRCPLHYGRPTGYPRCKCRRRRCTLSWLPVAAPIPAGRWAVRVGDGSTFAIRQGSRSVTPCPVPMSNGTEA